MGLFNFKKDSHDTMQTNEIKQASMGSNSDISKNMDKMKIQTNNSEVKMNNNLSNSNEMMNNSNSSNNQEEFINPFSNNNGVMNNSTNVVSNNYSSEPLITNEHMMQMNNNDNMHTEMNTGIGTSNQMNNNINSNSPNNQMFNDNQMNSNIDEEKIQEIVYETFEKLLEDKWTKLTKNVEYVVEWKEIQEREIKDLKNNLDYIRENVEKIEKKIMNKIGSYDSNIMDVNSEIKALEKVFQKITPTLINNVNELSKITNDLKEIKENHSEKKNEL